MKPVLLALLGLLLTALVAVLWRHRRKMSPEGIPTMPCDNCGKPTHINSLDTKDDGSGAGETLECQECYGPGWAPSRVYYEETP